MISRMIWSAWLAVAVLPALSVRAAAQAQDMPEEVKKIRALYHTYDEEGALALCNEYLVNHPGDPLVLELRAWSLRQLARFEDAIKTCELINPKRTSVKLLLAECLGMNKATATQAQSIVDEVAADDPNAIEPHLTRSRIYLAQGRIKEAASELNFVRTTKPKNYEGLLLSALLAEFSGLSEEAVKIYLPLVGKPGDFEQTDKHHERDAVFGLASCYLKLQQYEKAADLYQQLVGKFPKLAPLYVQLAIAQGMLERSADAMANLEKAVELLPTYGEYRARLGEIYRSMGRTEDALAQYQKVLDYQARGSEHFIADLKIAEILLDAGQLEKAKQHAEAALAVNPESQDALLVAARLREKVGDTVAAKEMYRKVIAKDPLLFDAYYRLALLLTRSEVPAEQAEGKQLLERHKKVEPLLQDLQRTLRERELAPRSPLILTKLCGLLNLAGEYEQAKLWGERSDKLSPRSPSTCIQLGYISANLGDNASALKYFERAQQLITVGKVEQLDQWVETLKAGKPLTLPMGERRPTQKPPDGAGAPAAKPAGGKR